MGGAGVGVGVVATGRGGVVEGVVDGVVATGRGGVVDGVVAGVVLATGRVGAVDGVVDGVVAGVVPGACTGVVGRGGVMLASRVRQSASPALATPESVSLPAMIGRAAAFSQFEIASAQLPCLYAASPR